MPGHRPHYRVILACFVAFVAFLLLAGLFPEADPVERLPGLRDRQVLELVVESPAKAHEARNMGLFGEWHRNPADDYQFWRIQAPVWVYPLAAAFRAFGTTYTTLRFFSIFHACIGMAAFVFLALRKLPPAPAVAAFVLLASNLFVTQTARSGLVEVAVGSWVAWVVLCLWVAPRHPLWLVASQAAFALAFYTKSGAIYVLPVLVVWNVWTFWDWHRDGQFARSKWLPVATAALLAVATAAYVAQEDYLRVLGWNFGHLVTSIDHEPDSNVIRFDLNRFVYGGIEMFPAIGALSLPGTLWLVWTVWRTRAADRWEALLAAWLVCLWLTLLLARIWTLRYSTLLFLPTYLVIGWAMARFWVIAELEGVRPYHLRSWIVAVFLASLATQIAHHGRAYGGIEWTIRRCRKEVEHAIGPGPAVIVGRMGMPVLLASPYDVFYVKPGFNTDPETIQALGFTHALITREDVTTQFMDEAGARFKQGILLTTCSAAGERLELYAYPEKAATPKLILKSMVPPAEQPPAPSEEPPAPTTDAATP